MMLNSPIEVLWVLTGRCNLGCVFCLADAGPYPVKGELGKAEREFVVDELIKNKVLKVYLTGGEPLLFPEVISYIKKLRKHDIFIELTTNGVLLNDELISELKKTRLKRVQVSINGSSPQVNDPLMGSPSFEKIIQSLKKLVSNEISTHVKVTLTKKNIADIPNLINLLHGLGIREIELCEVLPLGRGDTNRTELAPKEQDLINLQDEITRFNRLNNTAIRFVSFSLALEKTGRADSCSLGGAPPKTCLIMADGNVIPCTSANAWKLKNNILEKGLNRCWTDLENYGQFLDHTKLKGKCGNCHIKKDCQGGCRARAYQFTKDLWGEDPFCPYPVAVAGNARG